MNRLEISELPIYNGDLWDALIRATGFLIRTQVQELMALYSPENPEPVATLWAAQHAGITAINPLLEICAFNYRGNPYEEVFTPDTHGNWLTEITRKLFMDTFRTYGLAQKLGEYRLLASDDPLGYAFLELRECV